MIQRLRRKFMLITMSIVTLMLGIILGLIFFFTRSNIESANIAMMQSIANQPFRPDFPEQKSDFIRLPYFSIRLDHNGKLSEIGGNYYDLSDDVFLDDLIADTLKQQTMTGIIEEYHFRFCRVITPINQTIVYSDITSEEATLSNLLRTCFGIGILSLLAFTLITMKLAKWAIKPVEIAWFQQKQFVGDASHELKTPLTVITTNAELLQNSDLDKSDIASFSSNILVMARQMRCLVEQMLTLARTDQVDLKLSFDRLDLSSLLSRTLLLFEPMYFELGYTLKTDIDESITITGNEEHLKQAIDILLDNASKYTRKRGLITVSLKRASNNHILFCVSDEGDPIPEQEIDQLFKRFYRSDPSRSRSGSFGLGLAIAENIVRQHKGRIWAESRDGMNSFFIELH